jgi:hypothetical protein
VLVAAFLAGGFYESTYSLLAAAVWLGNFKQTQNLGSAQSSSASRRPSRRHS